MAVTYTSNKKNLSVSVHVASANATIVVAGNTSSSNIATGNETITGATITQVFWGVDGNGSIQLKRSGSLVAVYDSTGYYDYAGNGMSLNMNQTANVDVQFIGTANAYVFFELQKVGTFVSEYIQT